MKVTIKEVKEFAYKQMDAMWHNQTGIITNNIIKFNYKGFTVVNPWMDEKTRKPVNPYKYYGAKRTNKFIKRVINKIKNQ